ncbi:MAG: DHH family phosphoesterase [Acidobacteriaceae bacterium]
MTERSMTSPRAQESREEESDCANTRCDGSHPIGAVLNAIRQRQRFLLTSHARPDGDAVGSLLALRMLLAAMGKQAEMQLADPVPLIYSTLPSADQIRQASCLANGFDPDAVIFLECDSVERSRLQELDEKYMINIDHHTSGTPFACVNWIDTGASAVAEMVYRLALAANVPVSAEMATCLYTALLSDTGSFCYEGTGADTFALAKDLVELGANPARIAEDLYFSNPLTKMRLLGAALTTLQRDGRVAWLWITHDDMVRLGASYEDSLGIVNYAIGISGVEVAIFLRETADRRIRVSLRSKGKIRVTPVAEKFGGGGHENASGCNLDGPLEVAIGRILDEVRQHLNRSAVPGSA